MNATRIALIARVFVRDSSTYPHMDDRKLSIILSPTISFSTDDPSNVFDLVGAHEPDEVCCLVDTSPTKVDPNKENMESISMPIIFDHTLKEIVEKSKLPSCCFAAHYRKNGVPLTQQVPADECHYPWRTRPYIPKQPEPRPGVNEATPWTPDPTTSTLADTTR